MADEIEQAKHLVAELCASLYTQGHVSGTGGGISIKVGDSIVMAPSGVQKERMEAADMFVLDAQGNIQHVPEAKPPPHKPPKLSECAPLFMSAYDLRGAGAVLHGHSMNAVLASLLFEDEFCITHVEMIKGIAGHGFYDVLKVPIIENTARECELTDRLRAAIEKYPRSNAVLVRRHGVYVWGDSWIQAKTQFECYEYLFESAVKMHSIGIDCSKPPIGIAGGLDADNVAKKPRTSATTDKGIMCPYVVLDIEGTVAPISFVSETLFPYARARLTSYFTEQWGSPEVEKDVELLRHYATEQGRLDLFQSENKEDIIRSCVALCEKDMDEDKKSMPLKSVQGNIWTAGFASGEIRAPLFEDVPSKIVEWYRRGIKVYIYSSGSRRAQKDLFGHTLVGDLRPYLQGFFDTSSGPKVESSSYDNIALSLGVDSPSAILFATDNIKEAIAARTAGWNVTLLLRPGNEPIDNTDGFTVLQDFSSL